MGINISINAEDVMCTVAPGSRYELDIVLRALIEYLNIEFIDLGWSIEAVEKKKDDNDD